MEGCRTHSGLQNAMVFLVAMEIQTASFGGKRIHCEDISALLARLEAGLRKTACVPEHAHLNHQEC